MTRPIKLFLTELSGHLPGSIRGPLLDFAAFFIFKVWRPLRRAVPFHILRRLPISSLVLGPPKGLCATAEEFCTRAGPAAAYTPLHPPHEIKRPRLPATLDGEVNPVFVAEQTAATPRTFVARIRNARVHGGCGAVITPDDRLVADVSFEITRAGFTHSVFERFRMGRPVALEGVSAVLAGVGRLNYFHWMMDLLPRFFLLREAGFAWGGIEHFLIGEYGARFQKESLAILGVPESRCVACDPASHFRCANLLVPSTPGNPGNPPAWACDFLREIFLADAPAPPPAGGGRKIYVSRAGARFRRVLNGDEVERALAARGFETVRLEELTVREQARLFAAADVVVAPHGAGCTNVVFCRPGTAFVEIFAPRYVMACYWAISAHRRLRYACSLGKSHGTAGSKGHYFTMIEDIDVDCGRLLQTVDLCAALPLDSATESATLTAR